MRRGLLRAVSSALLLVSLASIPHPDGFYRPHIQAAFVGEPGAVISEFYPCALAGDEYFSIMCRGDIYSCMRNWSVTDGEGVIRFVADFWLFPGRPFTVSSNATSFWNAYNVLPDLSLDSSGIDNLVVVSGSFRLADAGDSLSLLSSDGEVLDEVTYGSANESLTGWSGSSIPVLRKGEVAKRLTVDGHPADSNTSADWEPFREFRYGYTEFPRKEFEIPAGAITAFTSPDCSLEVVSTAIGESQKRVCICTYEFSSRPICEKLLHAIGRGVEVRILVDGAPAGDMNEEEVMCLSVLCAAGCDVRSINGNLSRGIVQHVGALHSKYLIVDSSVSIVMSENVVDDGLPQDRVVGNRGWGIMLRDPGFARYLEGVFDSDSRRSRPDVINWRSDHRFNASSVLVQSDSMIFERALLEPSVSNQKAKATVVLSPDGSSTRPYLLDFIDARNSIAAEQFQADLYWTSRWTGEAYLNPLVRTLIAAGSRGVDEKILFDSAWFNLERNRQVVDCLAGNSTSLSSSFRLLDSRSPITLLHNKGAVIDGRVTAITSNNWVCASYSRNRELAVLVESQEIASHFMKAFDLDWFPDVVPPVCDAGPDLEITLGMSIVLDASGCFDDRMIREYSWDIDSDGIVDSHDQKSVFKGIVVGQHVIVLEVIDSWGNSATDEMRVAVISGASKNVNEGSLNVPQWLWLAPMLTAAGILATRFMRKRRGAYQPRNFNHRPRT